MCHQEPPNAIQIELAEGCNLRCWFCGINGIRGDRREYQFMSLETATEICQAILASGWSSRIEIAMHGEPSLNPHMFRILQEFRKVLPKHHLMMVSNGAGFLRDPTSLIDFALKSLNVLAIEDYEHAHILDKILKNYKGCHRPIHYPENKQGNPHRRRKSTEHDFVVIQDIGKATQGTHASLNNHSGCGSPKNDDAQGKRCAKPFRELSIRWNGGVAICCNDWRGYYKCGNVVEQSLEEIWQGKALQAARKKLYHGLRDFSPCKGCDALSYRTGLLPDKKGLQSLEKPDANDLRAIRLALSGGPLTKPVPRPWEAQKKTPTERG